MARIFATVVVFAVLFVVAGWAREWLEPQTLSFVRWMHIEVGETATTFIVVSGLAFFFWLLWRLSKRFG